MMEERLDIIIFGATGFTGQYAVDIMHKLADKNNRSLTWGVAGRNETRLRAILSNLGDEAGIDLSKIPVIIADLGDTKSIELMTSRTKLIINCCGPYRFMGETVVKACIASRTHHVDISGEPQYMERMQLEYNTKAQEAGVYIVSACGFDSIPSDLGLIFLQQNFPGALNSVETFLQSGTTKPLPGPSVNYGTWESAVYGLAHADELRTLRSNLYPTRMPRMQPSMQIRKVPFKPPPPLEDGGWALPFLGSDRSVMLRSQRFLYETKKKRPTQVQTYFLVEKFWHIVILTFMGSIFSFLCKFQTGRKLLLKYPGFFSCGFFGTEEPSKEKTESSWFKITLRGEGWKEVLSDPNDQYTTKPNSTIIGSVEGKNPGYGATCMCLILAGVVILTETDKLPNKGGVFPPGAVFADTTLINQLNENGVSFKIISRL